MQSRRTGIRLFALLAAAWLIGPLAVSSQERSAPVPLRIAHPHAAVALEADARMLERAVNEERTKRGLPALVPDERLRSVALGWAQAMRSGGFFGHYDPE